MNIVKVFLKKRPLVMMTAYDAPTAALLEKSGVDCVLVGDSLGMVLLGYSSTRPVSLDEMIHHARAVRRGTRLPVIGDLPYRASMGNPASVLNHIKRFVKEASLDAVKIEWRKGVEAVVRRATAEGIPIMGHVGLRPQHTNPGRPYRLQGRTEKEALDVFYQAQSFARAGAFSILMECIPERLAEWITARLGVPTIGIGAGRRVSGQVLVFHDAVGLSEGFEPRFLKRFGRVHNDILRAVRRYSKAVQSRKFPSERQVYPMEDSVFKQFVRKVLS